VPRFILRSEMTSFCRWPYPRSAATVAHHVVIVLARHSITVDEEFSAVTRDS
jgi:hypothetical protein